MIFSIAKKQDTSWHVQLSFVDSYGASRSFRGSWVPMRVVGSCGHRRMVDPIVPPEEVDTWPFSIWESRSIL